ncbi:sodium:proton antiporter [Marmoricola sp. URHB0036]|uniref:cation:proton antiporter n=1 Tax=Marmoricola sp. URHB0036 TaxID=1298863 RepID=UPI00040D97C6|nr:cation:proton antiporter [Marmoricola sp. URHB0036]
MSEPTFAVIALLVLGWAVVSNLLGRFNINGPLVFLVAGYLLANPDWGPLPVNLETPSIHLIAELTLALLLFADASRINVARLRRDVRLPARLLGIGLPLSIVLGSVLAAWLFSDLSWALAGFVGATLAPTDASLSAQVINDKRVPLRLRRLLNVESGLNDGIATPIVVFTLAVAASQLGVAGHSTRAEGHALVDLAVGLAVGVALGWGSAVLMAFGARRHWIVVGGQRLATLATALSSFTLAIAVDGNGFVAAFVAGIAFAAATDEAIVDVEAASELPELLGEVTALAVWFLFGAVLIPAAFEHLDVTLVVYALLSLTVVRVVPVALALVGTGLDRQTVLFVGWFGPRGLASVVFLLLAVEELGETSAVAPALAAITFTVLASVVLHGVSAGPLVSRYAVTEAAMEEPANGPRSRRGAHE